MANLLNAQDVIFFGIQNLDERVGSGPTVLKGNTNFITGKCEANYESVESRSKE